MNNKKDVADLGMEIHAVSSASKPIAGWTMRDAIQECRECCGGHGFLKIAGIGDIRNDHDANLTYEGENHVLIQQTTNWLLKFLPAIENKEKITTPMGSADFLTNYYDILNNANFDARTFEEVSTPQNIFKAYHWLICYLLKRTAMKLDQNKKRGLDEFTAKSNSQVYNGKQLAIAFIQNFMLKVYFDEIQKCEDMVMKQSLLNMFSLYGLWSLEKHLPVLYQGGFCSGEAPTTLIQESVLVLCKSLKNDAIALIDAIAPPDFILNSVLGASDGQVGICKYF